MSVYKFRRWRHYRKWVVLSAAATQNRVKNAQSLMGVQGDVYR